MRIDRKTYTITASPFTIDLSDLSSGDVNSGHLLNSIAELCIEMEGNTAEATLKAKSAFSNSTFKAVTDGSFAIGGGMVSLSGFTVKSFEVTTASSFPVYLNVTRQINGV